MTVRMEFDQAVREARKLVKVTAEGHERYAVIVSGIPGAKRLPRALVMLLENVVRRAESDDEAVVAAHRIVEAGLAGKEGEEIAFMPARVLFQDFTGVPVFVDLAAMRDAMQLRGGDPSTVNPQIPCTLVIDHSVIADNAGSPDACAKNEHLEAVRNRERFAFLKWASRSFDNVTIVPPGEGICHQLNIERFCAASTTDALWRGKGELACYDTLVGTDSHTTTANGLGSLGWGVGGIEAEAAALGCPISLRVPPVVELRLTGALGTGVSGMDLALTICELLRSEGVVGSLVEVTGEGVSRLSATVRSVVANMTPEYGATTTLFPVDEVACDYLMLTGRDASEVAFGRAYHELQGTFGTSDTDRIYARTITLDLSDVELSLAGPSRPHNRVSPSKLRERFERVAEEHGVDLSETFSCSVGGSTYELGHGTLAIAAITSCTTATDPAMMVAAGLLAQRAVERGLVAKPWVKRVFAPGSHATVRLLERAGLLDPLFNLGFYTCGFGCMSCIGNSGSIHPALQKCSAGMELTSVLSGNRNFDGRINPDVAQNFLCQPALVVAYALAGTMDIDLSCEPLGVGSDGCPVMLDELLPTAEELTVVLDEILGQELYSNASKELFLGSEDWRSISSSESATFSWDESSTYIRRPPYFDAAQKADVLEVIDARCLALLGDFVTTDHISPAGLISTSSPAARYLEEHGQDETRFNSYGARRGNHEVMMRGTFANVRLDNHLAQGRMGDWTLNHLSGELTSIFDAAKDYQALGVPQIIVAGKLYGSGSSRDWAAKGPALLGVRAVIAESFERIHRSNLVQMGVIPLQLDDGMTVESLGLNGAEFFSISPIVVSGGVLQTPRVTVSARSVSGDKKSFEVTVRIDTPAEASFVSAGGILPYVLETL